MAIDRTARLVAASKAFACAALVCATVAATVVLPEQAVAASAGELACSISFNMNALVSVGTLEFRVQYPSPAVGFVGEGADVSCRSLVATATASFFDDDASAMLTASYSAPSGFPGLTGLALCDARASTEPLASDFTITVTEADMPDGSPIEPTPAVTVLQITCEPAPTTTMPPTATTTTTLGPGPTTTTTLAVPGCGDPDGDGRITATDALITLRAAVGSLSCALASCDVDGNGSISAVDALAILHAAVGLPVELHCAA